MQIGFLHLFPDMSKERSYVTEPGYVIAAAMLLSVLDIIAVSLRFLARIRQRDALRIDDWLVLLATVSSRLSGHLTSALSLLSDRFW